MEKENARFCTNTNATDQVAKTNGKSIHNSRWIFQQRIAQKKGGRIFGKTLQCTWFNLWMAFYTKNEVHPLFVEKDLMMVPEACIFRFFCWKYFLSWYSAHTKKCWSLNAIFPGTVYSTLYNVSARISVVYIIHSVNWY